MVYSPPTGTLQFEAPPASLLALKKKPKLNQRNPHKQKRQGLLTTQSFYRWLNKDFFNTKICCHSNSGRSIDTFYSEVLSTMNSLCMNIETECRLETHALKDEYVTYL